MLLSTSAVLADDVVDLAASLIGRPYVWGAEGPAAFDCSGLTQYVYREFGIQLPRRAVEQSRIGDLPGRRLRRGDLLFFSTDTRKSLVTHVGISEGNEVMIDARQRHGRVRRDDLRDPFWRARFMFARRVAGADAAGDEAAGSRPAGRRRAATRIIERIAGELFRIPARPGSSR